MRNHRALWAIAAAAAAAALIALAARQAVEAPAVDPGSPAADARDPLVSQMLIALDHDHRARFAATRTLVENVARYCEDPELATAETWYALGLKKFYGDFDTRGAAEAFARAAELRPEWAWPINARGIVEFVEGRREAAQASFARALEMEAGWSRPHSEQVILHRRAGDLGEALRHAELALELEPDDLVNLFNYGVVLDDLGRHAEARARYEQVWAAAPDMAQAAYNLACGYAREGRASEAVPLLRQALEVDSAFRLDARDDADFDPIRGDAGFKELLAAEATPARP